MQIALPDFDRIFAALADATRRDIVRHTVDAEEGVAELASHYPMSVAAVQKHVAFWSGPGWSPFSAGPGRTRTPPPAPQGLHRTGRLKLGVYGEPRPSGRCHAIA